MKKILFILFFFYTTQSAFAQSSIEALMFEKKIERQINANEKHIYSFKMEKNGCLELILKEVSVDLAIDVLDPDKKKIQTFDSYYTPQGFEYISFIAQEKGVFFFTVYPVIDTTGISDSLITVRKRANQGRYEVNRATYYTEKEYKQKQKETNANKEKTICWLKQNALPLKSVKAESGFEDLNPLKEILKNVQIVGLGEATHGTREFFQMKHRLLEFLVKEMGFTVLAIEAGYAGCGNINDYILNGKGNALTALSSQGYLTWKTEEVLETVEWMRKYNTSVPENKKVKFVGIDFQFNALGGSFNLIRDYLKKVDPKCANENDSLLKLAERMDLYKLQGVNTDSCKNEFLKFTALFSMCKGDYVERSSETEYEDVFQHIKVIGQHTICANYLNNKEFKIINQVRDYYMASNLKELVQQEKLGTKVIVWGHNMHIIRNKVFQGGDSLKMLGSYLKETYGDKYFSFGFSFSKGSFQARMFSPESKNFSLKECTVVDAKENTLDWYLCQTGLNHFIISFHSKQLPDYLKKFTQEKLEARNFSFQFSKESMEFQKVHIQINKSYNALIYIDNTTRAKPILSE